MKFFRFHHRSVSDEVSAPILKGRLQPISQPVPHQAMGTTVRVLRYRGVSYIREIHSVQPTPMNEATYSFTNTKVSKAIDREYAIQTQQVGFLCKLYCIGWRQSSLQRLSLVQHWLLSLFLIYRKGYAAGLEWKNQQGL
jgi:hypothetical protein